MDSGDADLYERIKIKYRINYRQTTTRFIELLIRSMLHSGKSQCDAPEKITGLIKSAYKSANVYIKNALMYASLRMDDFCLVILTSLEDPAASLYP